MKCCLYNDNFAPITSELGFLKADVNTVATKFEAWQRAIYADYGGTIRMEVIHSGNLADIFHLLLPLTNTRVRYLFVGTQNGQWTACFDNGWRGGDPATYISYLAQALNCMGVRAVNIPNTFKNGKGRLGGVILELYERPNPILNIRRSIALVNEGNRRDKWRFESSGEPLPFEHTVRYEAKKNVDRFTPEMLGEYLMALGINAFSEEFYVTSEHQPAKLLSIVCSQQAKLQEYSLEEARKDF